MRLLIFLLPASLAMHDVYADALEIDNGDRLTGRITRVEKGKIGFSTAYAGEISIDAAKVRSLQSDELVTLVIDKTRHIHGTLSAADGKVRLNNEEGGPPIEIAAQSNAVVLPGRITGREWKHSGHVNVGLSDTSGNTVTTRARLDAELVYERELFRVTAGTTINHATDHDTQTESNVLAHAKYDRFITAKQYGYGNITLEHDRFKDIKLRNTIGAGRGFDAISTPRTTLSLEAGPSFVHTDFYSEQDESYPAARFALRLDYWVIPGRMQLYQRSEVFVGLEALYKSFARTKTGLSLPLRDKLVANVEYDVDWDGNPAPGRVSTDRSLIFTLGYRW
jgi:putative salt-induced outer membrane protein YdiY